ncbi:Protoheme IX farnesyltransferase [Gammaproteobacteria bacterium]
MATVDISLTKTEQKTLFASWRRYYELTKPKVVMLILFTTLVGMLLATPGITPWQPLVLGLLGIGMSAAAGAVVNQVVDQYIDALMERTRGRPFPSGRMDTPHAIGFAVFLAATAMVILTVWVNVLTAVLTFTAFIGYAVIYTVFLKRHTPQNIVWGGLAGALPPLLGWTAITGEVHTYGLLLVLLIFVWTPPHFWALAIKRREEYARANIPMLPVTHGIPFTKHQIFVYTLMLLAVSLMPFATHMSGLFYLVVAVVLGLGFVYHAWRLLYSEGDGWAMRTFAYSIIYLTSIFAALLIDHYL